MAKKEPGKPGRFRAWASDKLEQRRVTGFWRRFERLSKKGQENGDLYLHVLEEANRRGIRGGDLERYKGIGLSSQQAHTVEMSRLYRNGFGTNQAVSTANRNMDLWKSQGHFKK